MYDKVHPGKKSWPNLTDEEVNDYIKLIREEVGKTTLEDCVQAVIGRLPFSIVQTVSDKAFASTAVCSIQHCHYATNVVGR